MENMIMNTTAKGGPGITREEQETIITIGATSKQAEICSTDPVFWRRLDKMCERDPESYKLVREYKTSAGEVLTRWYSVPKKLVGFKPKRVMTEEQKAKVTERFKRYREATATAE
mgnify:FL=1